MKEIYERAEQVIAWLGKPDDGMREGMDAVCKVHRFYCRHEYSQRAGYDGRIGRRENDVCFEGVPCGDVPSREPSLEDWIAGAKIYERSYFHRLWMVQELVVARRARVACGAYETDFRCIRDFMVASFVFKAEGLDVKCKEFAQQIGNSEAIAIPSLQYRSRNGENETVSPEDLSWLLWRTRTLGCSDPRDKVFAILNLAAESSRSSLRPDYGVKLDSLYISVAKEILLHGPSEEDISSRLFESLTVPASRELPSWVPDWRLPDVEVRIRGARPFDATGMGRYCNQDLFVSFPNLRQVKLKGTLLATVTGVEKNNRNCVENFEPTLDLTEAWRMALSIVTDGKYLHTRKAIQDNFLRTMLADSWVNETNEGRSIPASRLQRLVADFKVAKGFPAVLSDPESVSEIQWRLISHCFFVTEESMMGLCPLHTLPGDRIALIIGSSAPVVLRERENGTFQLLGICYLHGFMLGEWTDKLAVDAKAQDPEYEDMFFDMFRELWTSDDYVLTWTRDIVLE